MAQNPDWREFPSSTENIPLMFTSSRVDSSFDWDRNDETRNIEDFEDYEFPAYGPFYNQEAHTHHRTYRKTLIVKINDQTQKRRCTSHDMRIFGIEISDLRH